MNDNVEFRTDPHPPEHAFAPLWRAAWNSEWTGDLGQILSHSIVHIGAFEGETLVGYVNVAWDGGAHAFLLDPTVHPAHQRRGIGSGLVKRAIELARERGARWMHVDYEPHLEAFYASCGFRPTRAGLIQLS
jgi:GNAT superfamily N-acetyltransferase